MAPNLTTKKKKKKKLKSEKEINIETNPNAINPNVINGDLHFRFSGSRLGP